MNGNEKSNNFQQRKEQCLYSKRDKSSAGKIDKHALDICNAINKLNDYYTTSSCSGRCYLYFGIGKSQIFTSNENENDFVRYRVNHELIIDPKRYFNLTTLDSDVTGGGDEVMVENSLDITKLLKEKTIWLRFEPFILHVSCRTLDGAWELIQLTRPTFKNVGLTSWSNNSNSIQNDKYTVAMWGDEGLDLPLTTPPNFEFLFKDKEEWLAELVNSRHERNWAKISQLLARIQEFQFSFQKINRSFDIIGDVALFHSIPAHLSVDELSELGGEVLLKNKALKICVARTNSLLNSSRSPDSFTILASQHSNRSASPLLTTHVEYGVQCLIDLTNTFFSPRMSYERMRLVQSVASQDSIFIPFCGCGMEGFLIASKVSVRNLTFMDLNENAIRCLYRSLQMLERRKFLDREIHPAQLINIVHGDALNSIELLANTEYDRIIAPRPKVQASNPDLEETDEEITGAHYLKAILPLLKHEGICHWYDFVAFHELPDCLRTKKIISNVASHLSYSVVFMHIEKVGSVAKKTI